MLMSIQAHFDDIDVCYPTFPDMKRPLLEVAANWTIFMAEKQQKKIIDGWYNIIMIVLIGLDINRIQLTHSINRKYNVGANPK